ncbi:MAG: hypothetical protein M1818_002798 [Claussenomyces sp. TS43310]|nr:MAG: hypothetical protein M1818_002798 [Claussenomyces sp. TS43310]
MNVRWDKESLPHFAGPNPDAVRIGSLVEIHSASQSCTFCNLVLAALCRNIYLYAWTDPDIYVKRLIERFKVEALGDPVVYLYSYLYAEDPPNGIKTASNSKRNDPEDSRKPAFQLGIGLRRLTSDTQTRPYLDHAAVINLVASSGRSFGIGPDFYGRIIKRTRANMDLAKSWLEECVNFHGSLCARWGGSSDYEMIAPQDLRVIDVKQMSLVMLPPGSNYVALSYCWGTSTRHFTTTKSNISKLEKRKSLDLTFSRLSGTIQDAIHCVRELDERFLWVDALCIIQDSKEEKEAQIMQMDRIYENSIITIIAASPLPELWSGYDCLPGYRAGTRLFTQEIARVRDIELCTSFPSVELITDPRNSTWSTRSWTFQEELLSRRRLYFTPAQIYFQCPCRVFCEDAVGEGKSPSASLYEGCSLWNASGVYNNAYGSAAREGLTRTIFPNQDESFNFYMDLVERYSCRKMSDQGDALIALEGIMKVLRKTMQTNFIWGLPESLFDDAFLWMQLGGPHCRRDTISIGYHSRSFPSWSWAGWEHRSNYRAAFFSIYTRPEIDWFLITKDGIIAKLHRVDRTLPNDNFNIRDHQTVRPQGSPPFEFRRLLRFRKEINTRDFDSASIACWTSIASFRFSSNTVDEDEGERNWPHHQSFIICDSESRDIGAIRMEKAWAARLEKENRFDFMLLSRANIVENMTHLDEDIFPIHDWCFLNILLIQWTGRDAQRLGIGWVHENAWVDANAVPTLVRLN